MSIALDDKVGPPRPSPSLNSPVRFASVRANLMPDDIINSRRADALRQRVLLGLVVVVLLLVSAYGASWWQTRSANNDLRAARQTGASLQLEAQQYAPLTSAQASTTAIKGQLQKLMADDLSWKSVLTTLRAKAPYGVTLTQIGGNVTAASPAGGAGAGAGAADGYQALDTSNVRVVGTLTLTGTAPDQRSVANYSDALSATRGLTAAFVTSVTSSTSTATFNITVSITADALGGRFAPPAAGTTPASAVGGN